MADVGEGDSGPNVMSERRFRISRQVWIIISIERKDYRSSLLTLAHCVQNMRIRPTKGPFLLVDVTALSSLHEI